MTTATIINVSASVLPLSLLLVFIYTTATVATNNVLLAAG